MSDLVPEWRVGSVVLTDYPFAVPFGGVDYGAPENVTDVIRALFDGDIEVTSRAGNRTVSLPVLIEESDMAGLAAAEALLAAECDKPRNEVYCDPGDGFGPPFIFDVFRGQLAFSRSDEYEQSGYRSYSLTFRALPYSRSVDAVTIMPTPTPVGSSRQNLYNFDSPGSARVEPIVHLGASASVGQTLIYTRPGGGGFIPLRQFSDAGLDAPDSSTVCGYVPLSLAKAAPEDPPAFTSTVPKSEVVDGTYVVMGLMRRISGITATTVHTSIDTWIDGYGVRGAQEYSTAPTVGTTFALVQMGRKFQIPSAVVADDALSVVKVGIDTAVVSAVLDEAWLVEVGTGALTWINGGAIPLVDGDDPMADAHHLWLEPASVDRPYKRILRGSASDQSDAFGSESERWGAHVLTPGVNGAATVTTGTTTGALDFTLFPSWHTHAGL